MGSIDAKKYDFVVVGAGPAGCMVATRLAKSARRPSVLLIEAGGKNDHMSARIDAERWLTRMNPVSNWGYHTVPQKNLDGLVVSYDRGKGLGGSSAINYSGWTVGASDDYEEIARIVGDEEWKWESAQERFRRIADYYADFEEIPSGWAAYLFPKPGDHGHDGPIKVGFPTVWEKSLKGAMDSWFEIGVPRNLDHNSGNPIGLAVFANSAHKGIRSTAADALVDAPANLSIVIESEVAKVLFDGNEAVGVETLDGTQFLASKEVIISTGTLDTPRILMHSGIGPSDQLEKFGIPVLRANANVGQHMMDHHHIMFDYARAEHTTERQHYYKSKELQAAARQQWEKDQTGPLSELGCSLGVGFLKMNRMMETTEFKSMPEEMQAFLQKPTVPHWEVIVNAASAQYFMAPETTPAMATIIGFLLNCQSRGTVTLQSADPGTPMLFDPKYLSHPYDRKLALEICREILKFAESPGYKKDTVGVLTGPKSDSEQDIMDFFKKGTGSTWHMCGTARMGKREEDAVVDSRFRVFGVERLRIADMSVSPVLPNGHTQAAAYHAGLLLGDKLVREYKLDV